MDKDIVLYVKLKTGKEDSEPRALVPVQDTLHANKIVKYVPANPTVTCGFKTMPKLQKELHAAALGYARASDICRKRKRQLERAHWMMVQHDHTCYEWSQWWPKPARKPKRWKRGK